MNIKRKKKTVRDNWGLFTHSPCCRSFICLKVLPEGLIMEAEKQNKKKQGETA
jgi:hypothetical protein